MDREFEKEEFETLKIKRSVAIEFRKFSKMLSKSQSMTLLLMMDFFNENRISILIKKRMNCEVLNYIS